MDDLERLLDASFRSEGLGDMLRDVSESVPSGKRARLERVAVLVRQGVFGFEREVIAGAGVDKPLLMAMCKTVGLEDDGTKTELQRRLSDWFRYRYGAGHASTVDKQSVTVAMSDVLTVPTRRPDDASAQKQRLAARYFEDGRPTTRADYLEINGRTKGDLEIHGPCPSCGTRQQFEDATKRQVGTVAKVIGGLFSQPVKTLAEMLTSADCIEMSCSQCRFGVSICGHCDQINTHEVRKCSWCGYDIL
jgi:hypothetical protein